MRIIHADLLVHPICPRPLGCHSTRGHNRCARNGMSTEHGSCSSTVDEMIRVHEDEQLGSILICECGVLHYEEVCSACRDAARREDHADAMAEVREEGR